jgi:cell division protein FtsL
VYEKEIEERKKKIESYEHEIKELSRTPRDERTYKNLILYYKFRIKRLEREITLLEEGISPSKIEEILKRPAKKYIKGELRKEMREYVRNQVRRKGI